MSDGTAPALFGRHQFQRYLCTSHPSSLLLLMVSEGIRIIAMCLREPRLTEPERYRFICISYPLFHIVCCSELGAVILLLVDSNQCCLDAQSKCLSVYVVIRWPVASLQTLSFVRKSRKLLITTDRNACQFRMRVQRRVLRHMRGKVVGGTVEE